VAKRPILQAGKDPFRRPCLLTDPRLEFSNAWKLGLKIFQGLEKTAQKIPRFGRTGHLFSKVWNDVKAGM
jgi:hypothetical protein